MKILAYLNSDTRPLIRLMVSSAIALSLPLYAAEQKKTWIDPVVAEKEDPDFSVQGEYLSSEGEIYGAQVVALGGGKFDAYLLSGGLPGKGWNPETDKIHLEGQMEGGLCVFRAAAGVSKMQIEKSTLTLEKEDGKKFSLARVVRTSPTLGAKPPTGAVVLFDGSSADLWEKGKMEKGLLTATGATTKQTFGSYQLHVEFRTPYKPAARGQGRGNSGIYHAGRWETQILDSFGLKGMQNECGGIYSIATPKLNLCLPPLTWQTYDVDLTSATFDAAGKRTAWPRITVRLNGVIIHENLELSKDFTPSAPLSTALTPAAGPVHLQDHGNPVMFQNIWILEK